MCAQRKQGQHPGHSRKGSKKISLCTHVHVWLCCVVYTCSCVCVVLGIHIHVLRVCMYVCALHCGCVYLDVSMCVHACTVLCVHVCVLCLYARACVHMDCGCVARVYVACACTHVYTHVLLTRGSSEPTSTRTEDTHGDDSVNASHIGEGRMFVQIYWRSTLQRQSRE